MIYNFWMDTSEIFIVTINLVSLNIYFKKMKRNISRKNIENIRLEYVKIAQFSSSLERSKESSCLLTRMQQASKRR